MIIVSDTAFGNDVADYMHCQEGISQLTLATALNYSWADSKASFVGIALSGGAPLKRTAHHAAVSRRDPSRLHRVERPYAVLRPPSHPRPNRLLCLCGEAPAQPRRNAAYGNDGFEPAAIS